METLKLVLPTKEDKQKILGYKQEFLTNEEEDITGSGRLMKAKNFEDWYDAVQDNANKQTVRKGIVPTTVYLSLSSKDSRLIGMIDIRHYLNDYLLNVGGHIGYIVRASERYKGYATEMVEALIEFSENNGAKIITAQVAQENLGSNRLLNKLGFYVEKEGTFKKSCTDIFYDDYTYRLNIK